MVYKYNREEITKNVIKDFTSGLNAIKKPNLETKKFISEADRIIDEIELFNKIELELKVQEDIAVRVLSLFGGPEKQNLKNYFWTFELLANKLFSKENSLEINLHLSSNDEKLGDILIPVKIIKCSDDSYRVWEALDIEEVFNAVSQLLDESPSPSSSSE